MGPKAEGKLGAVLLWGEVWGRGLGVLTAFPQAAGGPQPPLPGILFLKFLLFLHLLSGSTLFLSHLWF